MIDRDQLSDALSELGARDREVLDLSLRRRVPDDDLASVFGMTVNEVTQARATAIDRLSNALGVQRGEDLGHMLKLLLEAPTWDALKLEPAPAQPEPPQPEPHGHRPVGAVQHEPPRAPAEEAPSDDHEPVLGMLAKEPPEDEPSSRRGRRRILAGVAVALAVLAPAGVVAALTGGDEPVSDTAGAASATKIFVPQAGALADPFPAESLPETGYPIARVSKTVRLYDAPGGKPKIRVGPKTEFGSPRIVSIVKQRGPWLAVLVPELENGEVGWVREDKLSGLSTVAWEIEADLSDRQIIVKKDDKVVRKVRMGIGRREYETPKGRFAVTDKLRVSQKGSPYGCCVLALNGQQTNLPPGWPGGDRLAIHATAELSGLGKQVSLGCMRTDPRDTRWMLKRIPLGTPVFIRA